MARPAKLAGKSLEELCNLALEYGRQGKGANVLARELGVARQTIYDWRSQYPRFDEAMLIHRTWFVAYYEDMLRSYLLSEITLDRQQVAAIMFVLRTQDESWRESSAPSDDDAKITDEIAKMSKTQLDDALKAALQSGKLSIGDFGK